jgi:hypothetical protein
MIVRDMVSLDEEGFRRYLKKTGKSERKIEFDIRNLKKFEEYLLKHKGKKLEEAGYVEIAKEFIERKPHTALELTKKRA